MTTPLTSRPLFSILHTSARPDKWKEIYTAWMGSCKNPQAVEYVLCIDDRWGFTPEMFPSIYSAMRTQDRITLNPGRCYVSGVNQAAKESTGLILIVNADDQYPCQDWDVELIKLVPQCAEFAISVSTGTPNEHNRGIMVAPILSRSYYERKGYVFYPGYESMYADNDFYESAVMDKVLVDGRRLLFPHRHPISDPTVKVDEAYQAQNRVEAYRIGESVLTERRLTQFGRRSTTNKPIVMETPSTSKRASKRISIALPGENFSSAWVGQWTKLLCHLMNHYSTVDPIFCYSSNVHSTRSTIFDTVKALRPQPDYLLWVDDDNLVEPEQVDMLVADLEANPDVGIVAGWCYQAGEITDGPDRTSVGVMNSVNVPQFCNRASLMTGDNPLREIDHTGFPIVLMRGDILDKFERNAFAPILNPAFTHGFMGEDVSFCVRAREAGIKILVDRRVKVPHLKLRSAEPLPEMNSQSQLHSQSVESVA